MKSTFYKALTVATLMIPSYSCEKQPVQKSLPEAPAAPAPVDTTPAGREYTVKPGDLPIGLSGIVYRELGIRGEKAIRREIINIQEMNPQLLAPERDIYKATDCAAYFNSDTARGIVCPSRVVPGKDGLADVLYVGEKIILNNSKK